MKTNRVFRLSRQLVRSRTAANWARVRNVLHGVIPSVHSIGIITAWNPQGQETDLKTNQLANQRLSNQLKQMKLGPIKIKGKFMGNSEESFLVQNIPYKTLLKLCEKYNQYSVIYGYRNQSKKSNSEFEFRMVDANGQDMDEPRFFVLGNEGIQERDDMYSYLGGETPRQKDPSKTPPTRKKFLIPFFDPEYSSHE